MAYLAFHEFGGMASVCQGSRVAEAETVTDLSPGLLTSLEWSVVSIARNDGRATLRRPGRLTAVLRLLFDQRNPRLADDRLEALRRLAVLVWLAGPDVPSDELRVFLEAGFTREQFETILASVADVKKQNGA